MRLHEDKTLFRQSVQFTSDQMEILPIYIEKDYWVTFALQTIFNESVGSNTVFKGGTALSKCYQMIERFSEDIDLVMFRNEGEKNNQMTKKIKMVSKILDPVLPEIEIEGLTQKRGMNRKTAHSYTKEFEGDFGQVRDAIILEATWLGYYEPNTTKPIISFVGNMMIQNGQENIAKEFGLLPFDIRVLEPTRTICEKIMSLVRFSYGENPLEDLKSKIRHTYDLHQLLQQEEFLHFFNSDRFEAMLIKVANDDVVSFKNNNAWLAHHPNESVIFSDISNVWNNLKASYNNDFSKLVYGVLPKDDDVRKTLMQIKDRMMPITWNVKV